MPAWKQIWVPAWKEIWKPVWISEWFPSPDHHDHHHKEVGWDRKDTGVLPLAEQQQLATNQVAKRSPDANFAQPQAVQNPVAQNQQQQQSRWQFPVAA